MKPWHQINIKECKQPLIALPSSIHRLTPHPYLSLGAPYGDNIDPWRLRLDVVRRLSHAQDYLSKEKINLRLSVFDAWRPISVQKFMVDYVIEEQSRRIGLDPLDTDYSIKLERVKDEVRKFWASPSLDPSTPPPHSTGAAVDLTLMRQNGSPLNMGCEIDTIGRESYPDHFVSHHIDKTLTSSNVYHSRRLLLRTVMQKAGFAQHPKEWWHFSYGDQLWAWLNDSTEAIYGAFSDDSKSKINSSPK
tara:strand:- start:580 stop:1320 length:741 start_codon:yes stop_codon:yes gene_type:complete